jgi:hypothetical protein
LIRKKFLQILVTIHHQDLRLSLGAIVESLSGEARGESIYVRRKEIFASGNGKNPARKVSFKPNYIYNKLFLKYQRELNHYRPSSKR